MKLPYALHPKHSEEKIYWFQHWHDGDTWLDGYPAEYAFEALILAHDNHSDKTGMWIELIDWNSNTLH